MGDTSDHITGGFDVSQPSTQESGIRPRPEQPVPVRVDVGAVSHPGRVRPNNEDHFIVVRLGRSLEVLSTNLPEGRVPSRFEEWGYALAVADGMGGAAAGEIASALALSLGTDLTLGETKWHLRLDEREARDLVERVANYFRKIDRAVSKQARTSPALSGMGTTLTVAYTVGLQAFVFHVGDSRAYVFRDDKLIQLTRDQTLAQSLADAGTIPAEQVGSHHLRHVLTHAIGTGGGQTNAVIYQLDLRHGDRLLLCTDGLSDMVSDTLIARTLAGDNDPQPSCQALLDLALEAGGRDNVTVVVADYLAS
jgi:protein phosphatase